jgi:hypothetical protein
MSICVERSEYDPDEGRCQYHVLLKPNSSKEEVNVHVRVPVEVALSISENGDLADVAFVVPKKYRSEQALAYLKKQPAVNYVDPRVFLAIPGSSGDSVFNAPANLEVDAAGRIVGLDIH